MNNHEITFTTFCNVQDLKSLLESNHSNHDVINCRIDILKDDDLIACCPSVIITSFPLPDGKYSLEGYVVFYELLNIVWIKYASYSNTMLLCQMVKIAFSLCSSDRLCLAFDYAYFNSTISDAMKELQYDLIANKEEVLELIVEPTSVDDDFIQISVGMTPSFKFTINLNYFEKKFQVDAVFFSRHSKDHNLNRNGYGRWSHSSFAKPGFRKTTNMNYSSNRPQRSRRPIKAQEVPGTAIYASIVLALGSLILLGFIKG